MPVLLIVVIALGVVALAVLVPVAVTQRRPAPIFAGNPVGDASSVHRALPPPVAPAVAARAAVRGGPTSMQIALGVFIGLWLFALSTVPVAFALLRVFNDNVRFGS
jgi:hypothetical protein